MSGPTSGMTFKQRLARLTTVLAVRAPLLWRFLRRPFRRYFTSLAPRWDAIVRPGHLAALEAALDSVPPPRRALDVGTGTGAAALLLAERFPDAEVTGVDLSPAMVAAAQAKTPPELDGRLRFVEGDASALPVASGSCDLVTLVNMIPFFDELARVVAPEGTLVVSYSGGPGTPIWVPTDRLRRELGRRGFDRFDESTHGAATSLLARRTR